MTWPLRKSSQGDELTDVSERGESLILIRFQEGDDGVSGFSEISQERCSHPFAIDNEAGVGRFPSSLFIASEHLRQSRRQMLVSTRGRCQARMPLFIMQKRQRTSSQDFAAASDQSTRDQTIGIDRLAVPIDVKTGRRFAFVAGLPQVCCPRTQSGGERFRPIGLGKLTEKPLRVAISVGSMPSCNHCQCVSSIATQVIRSKQAVQGEEEERQEQLAQALWGTGEQRPRDCWLTRADRFL